MPGGFMKRREFIKTGSAGIIAATALPSSIQLFGQTKLPDVVWVENGEPARLLQSALKELGGIGQFVSKGDVVVIKPNIGWDRAPEFAANTNPDLIEALVTTCVEAGAKEVKVFDRTCNDPRRCYNNSGIERSVNAAGGEIKQVRKNKYKTIALPNGKSLDEWEIYEDYLEADKVINVPVAKHHGLSKVSLGMKNLMGVMGGSRGKIHWNFDEKLVDIDSVIMPHLTIIDAYRVLMDNGPQGGDLEDVQIKKTLVASSCMVCADITALELFGHQLDDIGHLQEAVSRGLHKYDLKNLNVKRVKLS